MAHDNLDKKQQSTLAVRKTKMNNSILMIMALLACLFIGLFVYFLVGDDDSSIVGSVEVGQIEESVSSSTLAIRDAVQDKLPSDQNEMVPLSREALLGRWFTTFNESSVAEITLSGDRFEIIYAQDAQGRNRKFSNGVFRYIEKSGKLTLYPDRRQLQPQAIPGVQYKILTTRRFDIFVKKENNDGRDLFFVAPEYAMKSKAVHPIFLLSDYGGAAVLKFSPTEVNQ